MSKLSRRWRRLRQAVQEMAGASYELDGCRFELPSWADDIKRNIRRGNYEGPERHLVAKWLEGDRTVVELGGSFGIVSGIVGARLKPDTRHVVVEANPVLIDYCRKNAGAARPAGAPVEIIGAAISYDGLEQVEFLQSDAFLGSRLAKVGETGTIKVPATTLRAVLDSRAIGDYDLVCDIEATELDMLRQDMAALSRCSLAIIEVHPDAYAEKGGSEATFLALLAEAGFDVVDREANVLAAHNRAFAAG